MSERLVISMVTWTGVRQNSKRMEKTEASMLVVKLSKLLLSRRHARKGKSRLGLSHRKKSSSTTSQCPVWL